MPDFATLTHEQLVCIEWHRFGPTLANNFWCFTGGREFTDRSFVFGTLDDLDCKTPIGAIGIGCARGVDAFVLEWAKLVGVSVLRYVADWDRFGEAAGAIRNGAMLEHFQPDVLGVFPGGTGTTNCAKQARKLGIRREHFGLSDDPFAEAQKWG